MYYKNISMVKFDIYNFYVYYLIYPGKTYAQGCLHLTVSHVMIFRYQSTQCIEVFFLAKQRILDDFFKFVNDQTASKIESIKPAVR